jgi:outer membrane lipoprotein carrier protein
MRRVLLLVVVLLVSTGSGAQEPIPQGTRGVDKLAAVLDNVAMAQVGVMTLAADFEQRRASRLLAEPSVQTGRFYFQAPDSLRWRFSSPRAMEVLIEGGVAITYRPAERRAERIEVGRMQRRVFRFLGAGEPIDSLRRYFTFTFRDPGGSRPYELLLEPASFQLKRRIRQVEVVIDRESFLPVAVAYEEADGDTTSYRFDNIRVNGPLPGDIFDLTLPADVAVVEVKLQSGE